MRDTLLQMLTYCRPMGSDAERKFRRRYLLTLPGAWTDTYGNIHVTVGTSRVLWSCHTDTVHRRGGRQAVQVTKGIAHLPLASKSNCLGADDTAGVYLMREMVRLGVPGHYIFHYGEERGGIGSSALADDPQFVSLKGEFDFAIALDRRGTGDVITNQGGGRCCSDAFALALADQIGTVSTLTYAPAAGIYTDTAEYMKLIPECTNLSVGYQGEHTANEELDLRHVDRLLGALCDLDTASLPVVRVPVDPWIDDRAWGDDAWDDTLIRAYERRCADDAQTWTERWEAIVRDEDIRWSH